MRVGLALSGERKANMWKCGCTKDAFPAWAAKVLALGYSVGRVEEVHSRGPRSAQAAGKGGAAGSVLERRLVRVYTPGTMTHAHYFDDVSQVPGGSGATRPLVALVEGPAGALGVAVLDAALGQVQVGQLEAGSGTGGHLLSNLLLRLDPAEVVAPQTSL
ncbi:DNA mismatch repair protein, partial [Haematococcus lacustris]